MIHAETGAIHSYQLVRSLTFRLANAMRKRG